MKKTISAVLIFVLVISFSIVYAESITTPVDKSKKIVEQISVNKKEIKALDKKIEKRMKVLKSAINELNKSKKTLNKEQIGFVKESIAQISDIQKKLKENNDLINKNIETMKAAKKKKDKELYLKTGIEIVKEQQERIEQLEGLVKLLDELKKETTTA